MWVPENLDTYDHFDMIYAHGSKRFPVLVGMFLFCGPTILFCEFPLWSVGMPML